MGNREFEKWADESCLRGTGGAQRHYAGMGWQARQPEIDALKHKLAVTDDGFRAAEHLIISYRSEIDALKAKVAAGVASIKGYAAENAALKAEVERSRKDAERLDLLERSDIELTFQLDEDEPFFVSRVTGGRNDREWKIIGIGETVRKAIDAAMKETK